MHSPTDECSLFFPRFPGAWLAAILLFFPLSLETGISPAVAQDQSAETQTDGAQAGDRQADDTDAGQDPGDAGTVESPDAEQAVQGTEDELTSSAKETLDALKAGDLSAAAGRSGALFMAFGIPALTVLVVLIVAYFIASFLARVSSAPIRGRVDETLGRFVGRLVFYSIMVGALLGVLQYFGIGVASFAAVIAAAGFAIGLAFQGTLSNFAAGVMLLVFRPFKVGDVINAAGITARVNEIDLFTTVFDTPDNRRIIVPNSSVTAGTIENITHHQERRVDVSVGIDYAADLQKTRDTLTAAAESLRESLIEGEGRGYQVALLELGDSAVSWVVRFWTTADDFWSVKEKLTAAVKNHLDEAGIGIPFPQLDVHVHQETP